MLEAADMAKSGSFSRNTVSTLVFLVMPTSHSKVALVARHPVTKREREA
jgi:hypothetical protein